MTSILVWVLMYVDVQRNISYSPPVSRINDCQQMQEVYESLAKSAGSNLAFSRCLQVSVPAPVAIMQK